jgi:hypothetical protein
MTFELLKRGKNDKSSKTEKNLDTKSKGEDLKKSMKGKDFATQENTLKPTGDKGTKGPGLKEKIGGMLSSVSEELSGGPKKPMPEDAAKEYWNLAKKELNAGADEVLEKYGDLVRTFAITEKSPELLEFHLAVMGDWPPEDIYETFIREGAKMQINLSGSEHLPLVALAQQGKYDDMDFKKAMKENKANIENDVLVRMRRDPDSLRAVFKRISGFTAPEKVGAGY